MWTPIFSREIEWIMAYINFCLVLLNSYIVRIYLWNTYCKLIL